VPARIPQAPADALAPAGFWARYAAWSLDAALLLPLVALLVAAKVGRALADGKHALRAFSAELPRLLDVALGTAQAPSDMARQMLADPVLAEAAARLQAAIVTLLLAPLLVYAVLSLPWAVLFERSAWQATPGKRAVGLRVCDAQGRRLTAGHALLRHFAAGLSWLTLNLGHALALVPPAHLALHDRISDARVLWHQGSTRLPPWARLWLFVQMVAMVVAFASLFLWLQAAMQSTMQQALGFQRTG